ncbi:Hypothetical predicted protein [Olea europaea subsp. europaea]|uniref:Uncharacterized protein n=1 Tax=Olea europaea subsp. europaea TaxID=158383 RepID=A0A8S0TEE8_OLEEU|nr:Hypothetical predicted protein [Olea europaea subsp. europaea]
MQQQTGQLEAELQRIREKLSVVEIERDQALDEIRRVEREHARDELRRATEAHEANAEALSPEKTRELMTELKRLKELLSNSQEEMKVKDDKIEFLELGCGKEKQFELALAERDASLDTLKESEGRMTDSLSESKKRIHELETIQSKELQDTKNELEESKHEITSLHKKIETSENFNVSTNRNNRDSGEEDVKYQMENLAHAEEGEKQASLKAKSPLDEMELLKNELKLAIEAEEKSTKAMEDLALVLKEVATEASQTKQELNNSQMELVHVRSEAEGLKAMVQSTEERYQKLLEEAKQEAELHRNTADRLKLEAEESLLAWNGKEMGFVSCIKRAEEENAIMNHECAKLRESLKASEHTSRVAREETFKLRDILKQALNEANAAKAAAGIAIDENSQLRDCLSEKDDALLFLTRENERLRINEAAARENMKEYKKLLSTASTELKIEDKEQYIMLKPPDSVDQEHEDENLNSTFSFNLEDLKFMNEAEDAYVKDLDEDPEKAEALRGSIFDANAETPKAEPRTPQSVSLHRRIYSSFFKDDGGKPNLEDFDHLDSTHDDPDSDRNYHRRRRTMFRRVGDLLMIRRSFHKKEPSTEYHKKELSTENQKREPSTENHKMESTTTESHKKEPSTENQKKEPSTEKHKKEPSTENHKKESSTE